jgi:hypothetical protein
MTNKSKSINQSNYEAYLLDYLEGKLSGNDLLLLEEFLNENADIKLEFETHFGLEIPVLSPSEDTYADKSELKKPCILDESECSYETELAIKILEGDATIVEQSDYKHLLANQPDFSQEVKLFSLTRITADQTIEYPYKSSLKRRTLIPLNRTQWMSFSSVAATLAVLLLAADLFFTNPDATYSPQSSELNPPSTTITESTPTLAAVTPLPQPSSTQTQNSQPAPSTNAKISTSSSQQVPATQNQPNQTPPILQHNNRKHIDPALFSAEASHSYASLIPSKTPNISFYSTDIETTSHAISLSDYLLLRFKKDVLNLECEDPNNPELKLYEIADAGLVKMNQVSRDFFHWKGQRDPNGNLTAYSLKTRLIEISKGEPE